MPLPCSLVQLAPLIYQHLLGSAGIAPEQRFGKVLDVASDQISQSRDQAHEAQMAHLNAALTPPASPSGGAGT